MDVWHIGAIALAGVFAGTVNTIAGGGSIIGIPALIFAGLPAPMANATNRVGVIFQSFMAAFQFSRAGLLDRDQTLRVLAPTAAGAIVGALLSVDIDEALFEKVIAVAMLVMLVAMLLGPKRWLEGRAAVDGDGDGDAPSSAHAVWRYVGFFAVGVYGGFLQAGVGIFLLAALVLFAGQDLVRGNATKSLLVGLFTLPPLGIYVYHDLVVWIPGLALAAGSTLGGWLGSKMTVSWGPRFVRWVLSAVIVVAASRLLGAW